MNKYCLNQDIALFRKVLVMRQISALLWMFLFNKKLFI